MQALYLANLGSPVARATHTSRDSVFEDAETGLPVNQNLPRPARAVNVRQFSRTASTVVLCAVATEPATLSSAPDPSELLVANSCCKSSQRQPVEYRKICRARWKGTTRLQGGSRSRQGAYSEVTCQNRRGAAGRKARLVRRKRVCTNWAARLAETRRS